MPQFDLVSFPNQTIWLFLVFLNFYSLVTYLFLPFLCENLKFRKKKLIGNNYASKSLNIEYNNQTQLKQNIIQKTYNNCEEIIKYILSGVLDILKPVKQTVFSSFESNTFFRSFYIHNLSYPKRFYKL